MTRIDARITSSVAILAAALWVGGMLSLGAIAAPVVFKVVPLPFSADAMTVVFRRFDAIAMGCAAVVLITEAVRGVSGGSLSRLDAVRLLAAVVASAAAIVQGAWLSPAIEALHRAGAIRGEGPLGLELDAKHHLAVQCGSTQALVLALFVVLQVLTVARSATEAAGGPT